MIADKATKDHDSVFAVTPSEVRAPRREVLEKSIVKAREQSHLQLDPKEATQVLIDDSALQSSLNSILTKAIMLERKSENQEVKELARLVMNLGGIVKMHLKTGER
jgi:hypothetical protein